MQGDVGLDPFHHQLVEGVTHAGDGDVTVLAVTDQLADHGVVVGRHLVTRIDVGFPTHAQTTRRVEALDETWRRHEGGRIFGVDPAFDGMATDADVLLGDRQGLAGGDAQLLLDEIHTGDHLGDRVLDLDPGVHLDEVELAVLVQELEGARTAVADFETGAHAALTDELAHLFGDAGCRRLFHHLLVTALHGAVPLTQIEGGTLTVCQHLDLDVARVLQVFLHVDHVVLEELARFGFGQGDGGGQL
ncbi:hypothetical protein D3C84_549180 [compost metagenome]